MRDLVDSVRALEPRSFRGRVSAVNGLMVEAVGPTPALALGTRARIEGGAACEIVGFRNGKAVMMPLDPLEGVRPGASLELDAEPVTARPCAGWLGRVVDAFGRPLDDKGALPEGIEARPLRPLAPPANLRARVGERLDLGVRALNTFAPICRGQRMGLFSGSGVGKSVLLSMLARQSAADVVVIALIGERGREVREFVEDVLGQHGLKRAVVVVATSDEPALRRRQAAHMAMTISEHFRDEGKSVLLLMDSITRVAFAQREIGLAAGEPPATRGYTPSVFAELPRLLERAGPGVETNGRPAGSITAFFSVLVEGSDHDEPIADAVRGILDGHVVMERAIAERGRFPAINVLRSVSRTMPGCCTEAEATLVRHARRLMATFSDMEELVRLGAYNRGADAEVDRAVRLAPAFDEFLAQGPDEATTIADGFDRLAAVMETD